MNECRISSEEGSSLVNCFTFRYSIRSFNLHQSVAGRLVHKSCTKSSSDFSPVYEFSDNSEVCFWITIVPISTGKRKKCQIQIAVVKS